MNKPKDFLYMREIIFNLALRFNLENYYVKFWRFINYGVVCGIGVLINYLVMALTLPHMFWIFSNALAIISAWMWNYFNSVGRFGYWWGFNNGESKYYSA